MISCQKATRLMSQAQEQKLLLMDRAALKIHLLMCRSCAHFGQQVSGLRNIARAYAKGDDARNSEPNQTEVDKGKPE